jgi:FkbM family methyltransferase
MRAALKRAEKLLAATLPSGLYFPLQDRVRPLLDRRTTGAGRRVRSVDGSYEVRWEDGESFRFPHKLRYCRYMYPSGLGHILDEMLRKYQDGPVEIDRGDIVFEVGANVGEFALAALRKGAKVYAAEPDPNAFACLRENVPEANIREVAINDRGGSVVLNIATAGADSSVINPSREKITVPAVTIASWLEQSGEDHIDFLKVEAEGFEPEVLQGARPVFDRIGKIAIDAGFERLGKETLGECRRILNGQFRTWRRDWMLFAIRR